MVGKNNKRVLREREANKTYRYAIRKLSVGVASVAVSATLAFVGAGSVSAEEISEGTPSVATSINVPGEGEEDQESEENNGDTSAAPVVEPVSETLEADTKDSNAADAQGTDETEGSTEEPSDSQDTGVTTPSTEGDDQALGDSEVEETENTEVTPESEDEVDASEKAGKNEEGSTNEALEANIATRSLDAEEVEPEAVTLYSANGESANYRAVEELKGFTKQVDDQVE